MADSNRIIFPDEVDDAKKDPAAAAAPSKLEQDKTTGGDTNTVEVPPERMTVQARNFISAPPNCPPGYEMGTDNVCREVFD